jgi:predicted Na+-dependent transporter
LIKRHQAQLDMNLKRIFGALLTVLGICGLIYAAVLFVSTPSSGHNVKVLITYGILGLVFFVSGLSLVRTTKDES